MEILAIDIGGTKTATAVCHIEQGRVASIAHEMSWSSRDHKSFDEIAAAWRGSHPGQTLNGVGIGVPGPVSSGFLKQFGRATNLGWHLEAESLRSAFGVPVFLFNDMESHGWGILGLGSKDVAVLNAGQPGTGCKALIAAGTGLGESIISWDGTRHVPIGGEGGHSAFSPSTPDEDRLLPWLREVLDGHVSWERILGGRYGFRYLAQFAALDSHQELPVSLMTAVGSHDDWGASIIQLADQGDSFCKAVLTWYATLYGREASNLAVKCVPHSGVYIGGGIAPRILPWLHKHFMTGFTDKGRFSKMLSDMPVYVITDTLNGLKGAAIGAWHQIQK